MKHMGNDERNRIEFMLGCGRNITDIAKALGRSQSTISRELLNRRIESEQDLRTLRRMLPKALQQFKRQRPQKEHQGMF